ncbi:MAG: Rrf2 family transcriptional regulator [Clostridiales Family XIII bacterium]|jgi:Rrf2 family protein|nr:Rrf2 family transcriptional regulator [Clostridiales Family XIII bacterium]
MRISVKGRYALAAVTVIAQNFQSNANVTVNSISETLGISKIYLEQVFAQLKREKLLLSIKGPNGGYQLSRPPQKITAWEVLAALETSLMLNTENTVSEDAPEIETAMQLLVFKPLNTAVAECLKNVTVRDLADLADKQQTQRAFMMNM